ncbi:MAG: hypothetical protein EXR98_13540 [Gemmataceae bacterium]|nr:hypothetical protein [Gemmataceae bacterium]
MRKLKVIFTAACLAAAAWSVTPVRTGAGGINSAAFDKLHKELSSAKEPWRNLPWQLSLVQACSEAAKENKPVYMLCRSGHPLGCV